VARHLVEASVSSTGYRDPDPPPRPPKRAGSLRCLRFGSTPSGLALRPSTIALLGDLDGFGVEEIALGVSYDSRHGKHCGAVWIVTAIEPEANRPAHPIDATTDRLPAPLQDGDNMGRSLAPLGDLDGDGTFELAVGLPGRAEGGERRGAVWIFSLDSTGEVRRSREIGASHDVFGDVIGDHFELGCTLAALGDVDGDGVGDLAVGENDPGYHLRLARPEGPRRKPGAIWILFLSAEGEARKASRIGSRGDAVFADEYLGDNFDGGLCGIGDLDGDGVPELAAGDTWGDDGGERHGAIWILFLDREGQERRRQKISDWEGGFTGILRREGLGGPLAAPGDVNGDGIPDLAVGAPNDPEGGDRSGAIWVLFLKRDGTVASHQKINDLHGGFTDVLPEKAELGQELAAVPARGPGTRPRLLVLSSEGSGSSAASCVWFLDLAKDGTVVPR